MLSAVPDSIPAGKGIVRVDDTTAALQRLAEAGIRIPTTAVLRTSSNLDRLLRRVLEQTTLQDLIRSEPTMATWLGERFGDAATLRKEEV